MRELRTWKGPGDSWPKPSAPSSGGILSANRVSRWLPYRDDDLNREITSGSPRNLSGASWEQHHAGIKSAAISDNIGKM